MKTSVILIVSVILFYTQIGIGKDIVNLKIEPSFKLYLIDGKEDISAKKTLERIGELELVEEPLITEKDILSYHWETHVIVMTKQGFEKFKKLLVKKILEKDDVNSKNLWEAGARGRGFMVVVNGQRAHIGAFSSPLLSVVQRIPRIDLSFSKNDNNIPENSLCIELFNPDEKAQDPRSKESIKSTLEELKLLK